LLFFASSFFVQSGCSSNKNQTTEASGVATSPTTNFGDELSLAGYSSQNKNGHTEVEFQWKVLRQPAGDYHVFVHALDASGTIVFQMDHPLKNSAGAPTSAWAAGNSVPDRFIAAPPHTRQTGTYTLRMGVYVPVPMKFLPLIQSALPQPQDGWKGHSVLIQNVECK